MLEFICYHYYCCPLMFYSLLDKIINEIETTENRKRSRNQEAKENFRFTVEYLLKDLWKASLSIPPSQIAVNLRSAYYSENNRYLDQRLTYRQIKAALIGLENLGLIELVSRGYFSRERRDGKLTRYSPTLLLVDQFRLIQSHPAFYFKDEGPFNPIILRHKVDGKRQDNNNYTDTPSSVVYRSNLQKINDCLKKHWVDLRIKDEKIPLLAERIFQDVDREPIDLSRRTLVRIFTNGSFEEGGRFYRAWWQNVPSEYRPYITIDEQVTTEYDYSQLSPHMLYFSEGKDLGNEDAYDRVLDGQHRDVVKQAFNAMVQSSKFLTRSPKKIDLSSVDLDWKTLRDRILETHKPIQHLFFKGTGNQLQFWDSCMAESIMLHFAGHNEPVLPIHDSFIMRQGYASELEEVMRKAFIDKFGNEIRIKRELIVEREALFDVDGKPRIEAVTKDDREHSQWYDRNTMWLNRNRNL